MTPRPSRVACSSVTTRVSRGGGVFKSFFVQTNSGNTANRTDVFATSVTP